MTLSSITPLITYTATAGQTDFPLPNQYYDVSDIHVWTVIGAIEVELSNPANFSVIQTGTEPIQPGLKTGIARLAVGAAEGIQIVVGVWPSANQDQRYHGIPITARQRERVVDRGAISDAMLRELAGRAYRAPLSEALGSAAGRTIGPGLEDHVPMWDENGNLITGPSVEEILSAAGVEAGRSLVYPEAPADPVYDAGGRKIGDLADGEDPDDAATFGQLDDLANTRMAVQQEGVDVASRPKLDVRGSGVMVTDDGTRVRFQLLESFVTPFEFGGVPDGPDATDAIQDMWDSIKLTGGKVSFCGQRWKVDGLVNMRIVDPAAISMSFDVDAYGAVFDCSDNALTSVVDCFKIGSDVGVMAEHSHYNWSGGLWVGVFAGVTAPGEAGVAAFNHTAVAMLAGYNVSIKDMLFWGFRWGFTIEEVYTNTASNIVGYGCYVGVELRNNCTHGNWIRSGGRKCRFGTVLRPSTDTGSIYGQTFTSSLTEGCAVGVVHDPRNGVVNSITYISPYLEAITRDAFRIGKAIDYDDATNVGANQNGKSEVLAWYGGVWSPMGAWGDPGQNAILFNDGGGAGQPDRILLLNLPSGVSVGINSADCSNVTQLP